MTFADYLWPCLAVLVAFGSGLIIGMVWERLKWNRLIDEGVIPPPRKNTELPPRMRQR